jgi:hypothetical protein
MSGIKLKFWRAAGAAAVLGLAAACGGDGDTTGAESDQSGEAPAPAAPAGGAGGEAGEAGAASAYAGLTGEQLTALRLQHLKGFVMIAQRVAQGGDADAAAVLVQQGLLEVYDPFADQFGGLDTVPVRAAAEASGLTRAQMLERLGAAAAAIDMARGRLAAVDEAALTARMVDIATGLYQHVVQPDFVDALEYQHSMGAALAARDAMNTGRAELRAGNAAAYDAASTELDRFVALWPQTAPTVRPATYQDLLVQASRVRLALYPFLYPPED